MILERNFINTYRKVKAKHQLMFKGVVEASKDHQLACMNLTKIEMQLSPDTIKKLTEYVDNILVENE